MKGQCIFQLLSARGKICQSATGFFPWTSQPALMCLDVIRDARENFSVPIAAYHVSGESAMIRAACELGYLDAEAVIMESLTCIKRAGADMIITYSALVAIARW